MRNYPHYFAPGQLYDLQNDPGEQTNLATGPAYADVLAEMQARLSTYLDAFARPFELSIDEFLTSDVCDELTQATLADDRIHHTYWYLQHATDQSYMTPWMIAFLKQTIYYRRAI